VSLADAQAIDGAIDESLEAAVRRYQQASLRTLQVLDAITVGTLGTLDLDALLRELLATVMTTLHGADAAAILLVEDGRLKVRAAVGLLEELDRAASIAVGEGFAGGIARSGEPMLVRSAATDPKVTEALFRERGIRALYGVPLVGPAGVIGVAQVGSRTEWDFGAEDKLLFRAISGRAAALIVVAQLREGERLARRRAEREAAVLSAILDASADPITVLDREGRFLYTSPSSPPARGRTLDQVLGHTLREVIQPGPDVDQLEAALGRVFATGRSERGELRVALPDGERVVEWMLSPVRGSDGTIHSAVAHGRDVTERQQALAFAETLIGVLGHDLRSPIQAVLLSAQRLIAGDPSAVKRAVERIRTAAERMARMVADLLDYTRARAGHTLPLELREVDLGELCRAAIAELEVLEPGRPISLDLSGDLHGLWDRDRLLQVLVNLGTNALRYSPPGSRVALRAVGEPAQARLCVHNHGEPIARELRPRLFEAFRRGRLGGSESLGLGLFIVRTIVEAHGGSVAVESDAEGTTFEVHLPRVPLAQHSRAPATSAPEPPAR
jgi:PAS domain S-box-containing protein